MKLEITPEKILEAAEKCPQAKETLKTLFPEVFEEDKSVDCGIDNLTLDGGPTFLIQTKDGTCLIGVAKGIAPNDKLYDKCFFLNNSLNWEIIEPDNGGHIVIIPTRK